LATLSRILIWSADRSPDCGKTPAKQRKRKLDIDNAIKPKEFTNNLRTTFVLLRRSEDMYPSGGGVQAGESKAEVEMMGEPCR